MCDDKKVEITHELGCGWIVTIAILAVAAVNIIEALVKR